MGLVSFGVGFECVLVGGVARENTVDLKTKRIEAVGRCVGRNSWEEKCRIMNGETKDWQEKETERGECTKLEAEISL